VILSAIINVIDSIWYARNQGRFNNSKVPWQTAISLVYSNVSLSGNNDKKVASTSVRDFQIMKEYKVTSHALLPTVIKVVLWHPPIANWIKCNIDGAALGSPGQSSCGGLFRDSSGDCIGCFAENLGVQTDFYAELMGAINAIEIASSKNWQSLWLETDSKLVQMAIASTLSIPWQIRNRWLNCTIKI